MGTQIVRINDDLYEFIKSQKRDKETFSDTIERLIQPPPLTELAGILDEDEADEWLAAIEDSRKAQTTAENDLFEVE